MRLDQPLVNSGVLFLDQGRQWIGNRIHENAYRTNDFGTFPHWSKVVGGIYNQPPPATTTSMTTPLATTTTTPPRPTPDGHYGDPFHGQDYWISCAIVSRNEPIATGQAGNFSLCEVNMPGDLASYHYTPTGKDQPPLGLTTAARPAEICRATSSQCEMSWGTEPQRQVPMSRRPSTPQAPAAATSIGTCRSSPDHEIFHANRGNSWQRT
jgi:hypothetical protein